MASIILLSLPFVLVPAFAVYSYFAGKPLDAQSRQ